MRTATYGTRREKVGCDDEFDAILIHMQANTPRRIKKEGEGKKRGTSLYSEVERWRGDKRRGMQKR